MLSKNPSLENIPIEEHLNSPVNEKLPSSSKTQIQPVCEEREIKLFEKKQLFPINHLHYYEISPQRIFQNSISNKKRMKLISWLSSQMALCQCSRETFATACRYLDIYLSKNTQISIDNFQSIGVACVILSAKVIQSKVPKISFQTLDKATILRFEKEIFTCLKYQALPLTYVALAQSLLHCWEQFYQKVDSNFPVTYFQKNDNSILRLRSLMEILDCIYLVPWSFSKPISSIILAVFFFENRLNCLLSRHPRTIQEAILIWEEFDEYREVFNDFILYLMPNCSFYRQCEVSADILQFVIPFLSLRDSQNKIVDQNVPKNMYPYMVMTNNPQASSLAQKVTKKLN